MCTRFFGNSAVTSDELGEIRRREFRAIREELDLNQTDFGALVGRKRDMIKNYENGYPIPEKIMETARYLQANPPPRLPILHHRGAAVLVVMRTGQEARGMRIGTIAWRSHRTLRQREPFPRGSGLVWRA